MRIVVGRAGDRRDAFIGCVVTADLLLLLLLTLRLEEAEAVVSKRLRL